MKTATLNLALQGGGAHGAFTWGVLDRLLEDERLKFGWVSATSAGAVNAVGLAHGLAQGSRKAARETLYKIWHAVHQAGVPDLLRLNPFLSPFAPPRALAQVSSLWSPYEFNPLGFDPLRRLLSQCVDFDLVRAKAPFELMIAATHVHTGRARLFRNGEITVEAVLASACLPSLHHAVEIGGASYWDGGFSANPDLVTLAAESPIADTLLVTVAPRLISELPTTARDIAIHMSRLQFNAPLIRDVGIIAAVREAARSSLVKSHLSPLLKHRFHLIDGGEITGGLSPDTSVKPDWTVITYLHGAGRAHAEQWLTTARASVGRYETVDLSTHFLAPAAASARAAPARRQKRSAQNARAAR